MRFMVALMLSCCAFGFAQETTETPSEVVKSGDEGDGQEVASVDSHEGEKSGCGCGKPK
jgi:hypothetical protein